MIESLHNLVIVKLKPTTAVQFLNYSITQFLNLLESKISPL